MGSEHDAPINVNSVGWGGGGWECGQGVGLASFKIFGSNSPEWETKG